MWFLHILPLHTWSIPPSSTPQALISRTIYSRRSTTTLALSCPRLLSNLDLTFWVMTLTPDFSFDSHFSHCLVPYLTMAPSGNVFLHHQLLSISITSLKMQFKYHLFWKDHSDLETRNNLILNSHLEGAPFSSSFVHSKFTRIMLHCAAETAWPSEDLHGLWCLQDMGWTQDEQTCVTLD